MKGFDYYIDKEILEDYKKKPLSRRLEWLYQGNKLRQHYPKDIIKKQDKFRRGEV